MARQSAVARLAPRAPAGDDAAALAIISKGGGASQPAADANGKVPSFRLRMTEAGLLERIDAACDAEFGHQSRNTWIMRACLEKLERDGF